jgi:hypothetical protein
MRSVKAFERPSGFYVYAYFMPSAELPFYIGKGCGRRLWDHLKPSSIKRRDRHLYCRLAKMLKEGVRPEVKVVEESLSGSDAAALEVNLIRRYGRIDNGTGVLVNHTDGGEGTSGRVVTETARKKISAATKGKLIPPEIRKRMSEAQLDKTPAERRRFKERYRQTGGKAVCSFNLETGGIVKVYDAMRAVDEDGFRSQHVWRVVQGRRRSHKGLGWRYADRPH